MLMMIWVFVIDIACVHNFYYILNNGKKYESRNCEVEMSHSQSVSSRNRKATMIMHVNINIILTVMFSHFYLSVWFCWFFLFTLTAYHYYSGVTLNSVHFIMKLLVSFLFRLLLPHFTITISYVFLTSFATLLLLLSLSSAYNLHCHQFPLD